MMIAYYHCHVIIAQPLDLVPVTADVDQDDDDDDDDLPLLKDLSAAVSTGSWQKAFYINQVHALTHFARQLLVLQFAQLSADKHA